MSHAYAPVACDASSVTACCGEKVAIGEVEGADGGESVLTDGVRFFSCYGM